MTKLRLIANRGIAHVRYLCEREIKRHLIDFIVAMAQSKAARNIGCVLPFDDGHPPLLPVNCRQFNFRKLFISKMDKR